MLNARRLAPHVYLPRIVVPNIKNKRNSHFTVLQTDLSRSVLLFKCELRLLTYRHFAIVANFMLLVWGISHSAECDQGLCPLDTHHPLKSVDVNFNFVQPFSIICFYYFFAVLAFFFFLTALAEKIITRIMIITPAAVTAMRKIFSVL